MDLKLACFYPSLMNLYGDNGNIMSLTQRCRRRGIGIEIAEIGLNEKLQLSGFDLAFFGGGQDKEQLKISADLLKNKARDLKCAIEDGLVMLAVCGGFQLLGEYYQPIEGPVLYGMSILDLYTQGGSKRAIGNIIVNALLEPEEQLIMVGFENQSGRTYLGSNCRPLGKVVHGFGNNGTDGFEGARYRNCFGTYLHGPLLPKNPKFADYLISLGLIRKYGKSELIPLDDQLENQTRDYIVERVQKSFFCINQREILKKSLKKR